MLDFSAPPYSLSLALLEALRVHPAARAQVRFSEARSEARGTHDLHEEARARVAHLLLFHARPGDLELLRFLLDQEILARRSDSFQGAGDPLAILSMLVLEQSRGAPEDTLRFWAAKTANFDTYAGGYDVEFVFSQRPAAQVLALLRERGDPETLEMLDRYDPEEIEADIPAWRASLARRYPRRPEALEPEALELWAEVFGDLEAVERHGLEAATSAQARAYVYQRVGKHAEELAEWRAAAAEAEQAWERASRLHLAIAAAAKAPMDMRAELAQLEALRLQIPEWPEVGLGRMATEAAYALAAALDDPALARPAWEAGERWRAVARSLPLSGLRAGLAAAERWGRPEQARALSEAVEAEQARIEALLADLEE